MLRLLTIAGSDSGGGAGIQADLKTFAAHGAYGMSAITAVTAQNTVGVSGVERIPAAFVREQIDAVLDDLGADAVKVGMVADREIAETVADVLATRRSIPRVVDPVMVAASGDRLLDADAVAALRERLLPGATVATPNLPEAEILAGRTASGSAGREELVRRLGEFSPAVLLKGGHVEDDPMVDLLWDGSRVHRFVHRRHPSGGSHGTGCTLSSAIAVRLARGESLVDAVGGAIDWLQEAIVRAVPVGKGAYPVDHLWRTRTEGGGFA
ncbi:MAG: bifunctional hydroxymethylpyrimidine kinase/phosphomethylpyrimidine kinase [Thermoanaerobaculia bacterium]